jgi:hypothetical protein
MRRAVEQAEARVHGLEARSTELNTALGDPALYETSAGTAQAEAMAAELDRVKAELDVAYAEWEARAADLETLEAQDA